MALRVYDITLYVFLLIAITGSTDLPKYEVEVQFDGQPVVIQFSPKEDLRQQAKKFLTSTSVSGNLTLQTLRLASKFEQVIVENWMTSGRNFKERRNQLEFDFIIEILLQNIQDTSKTSTCVEYSSAKYIGYDIIGLATYPNSGTGWTLKVVRDATGIQHDFLEMEINDHGQMVASLPTPKNKNQLEESTFPTRFRSAELQEPLFVYTHSVTATPAYASFSRIIRIVRNPIDNIWANWRWMNGESSGYYVGLALHRPNTSFPSDQFEGFILRQLKVYFLWHCCIDQISKRLPVMTVSYEDMLSNPVETFKKIIEYIGYDIPDDEHLEQVIQHHQPIYNPGFQHVTKILSKFKGTALTDSDAIAKACCKISSKEEVSATKV
eukprot:CAMPEP_0117852612 /NCGR_PEP_ID=MMETSP0949-20121206/23179_1 /TAXON_ID=44440 /ORGANISM="Chattonella subsalsa, Strain CCMP2191" /LENGTH=379 /DNA_ID=CAMNT_0005700815 /DNA_START=60 /DNA_END=1200 /DNA_ORIENTATION=-